MKIPIILIISHLFSVIAFGQKIKKELNDFSVSLHENTINKVLGVIGDIHGNSDYEVLLLKGKYDWIIKNSKINIRPDSSNFVCDAFVKLGIFKYKTKVVGFVKISYNDEKNKI